MPLTDEEVQILHDTASEGKVKDLYAEVLQARKTLPLAKKIAELGPILETNVYTMQLQGCPKNEMYLAVLHKKPDGTGRVGPTWDLGEFGDDLSALAKLLTTEEEMLELNAAGIVSVFGAGGIKSTPVS